MLRVVAGVVVVLRVVAGVVAVVDAPKLNGLAVVVVVLKVVAGASVVVAVVDGAPLKDPSLAPKLKAGVDVVEVEEAAGCCVLVPPLNFK